MAKLRQRSWKIRTCISGKLVPYCAALAGRAVALNGRMPNKAKREEICDAKDARQTQTLNIMIFVLFYF